MPSSSASSQIVPSDVVVHLEPRAPTGENIFDTIRAVAQKHGLPVHELSAHSSTAIFSSSCIWRWMKRRASPKRTGGHRTRRRNSPRHRSACTDQYSYRASWRADRRRRRNARSRPAVQQFRQRCSRNINEMADCHEVHVRSVDHKILVSCHCAMPGNLPVTEDSRRDRSARGSRKGEIPPDLPRNNPSGASRER